MGDADGDLSRPEAAVGSQGLVQCYPDEERALPVTNV
jgi:hypothetical protein